MLLRDIKDSWAHQILQSAHKNFKWPVKILKFVWDMGHLSILRAHHVLGLGLSLLHVHRGSYISARVFLNLLNEL